MDLPAAERAVVDLLVALGKDPADEHLVGTPGRVARSFAELLVTAGVVNTMPEATLNAVADHGRLRGDTVRGCYAAARQTLDALAAVGVDYDAVVTSLETEGVAKFAASGAELATLLAERLRTPPAVPPESSSDPDQKETPPR